MEALNDYKHIIVSLAQKKIQIDKNEDVLGIDEETGIITMHLAQEETGLFKVGETELQVNIYYEDTERDTSAITIIDARKNLYNRVMTDE